MSRIKFFCLCAAVLVLSIVTTILFGCDDKPSVFIASLGSFGTLATLYVAYEIFITYNAPADIQKKRFELVDNALAFFITKRFLATTERGNTYFLYLTKQRLDYCLQRLTEDNLASQPVVISHEFFSFLLDFQSQLENHYFPYELKMLILSNLPQGSTLLPDKNFQEKIRVSLKSDDEEYGYPFMKGEAINISDFIIAMDIIRVAMINYLNNKVPHKYQIIDESI